MLGTVVDVKELWETVAAAAVAGTVITASFSLMIFGAARYADLRRDERSLAAGAAAVLTVAALLFTAGAIVLGIIVMTTK
jgi:hypothetical protein